MKECLSCPFCGWEKIRIIERPSDDKLHKDSLYTFAWCKVCGTRGPWAYNVDDDEETVYNRCVDRWNERHNDNRRVARKLKNIPSDKSSIDHA